MEKEYISPYMRMWADEKMKGHLVEQLKENKHATAGKKITEKALIEQYFRIFLGVPEKDKLKLIIHQPALLKEDYDEVNKVINESKVHQLKWACIMTTASYAIYHLAFAKKKMFYEFFRKPHRFRIINHFKRGMGLLTLFVVNMNILNYFYDKTIPNDLLRKGIYKKYFVEYEKQFL